MTDRSLTFVFDGWDGYNRALMLAVGPLTAEQLSFRSIAGMRSVGELAWHIADGRVDWLGRISPADFAQLKMAMEVRNETPMDGNSIAQWLDQTWRATQAMLDRWTVEDLSHAYEQPYQGKVYQVSRQWVIWRILSHDIHHGGQLSELLAMQGIEPPELLLLGGHLSEPPVIS